MLSLHMLNNYLSTHFTLNNRGGCGGGGGGGGGRGGGACSELTISGLFVGLLVCVQTSSTGLLGRGTGLLGCGVCHLAMRG
jgi:hypothetical protein